MIPLGGIILKASTPFITSSGIFDFSRLLVWMDTFGGSSLGMKTFPFTFYPIQFMLPLHIFDEGGGHRFCSFGWLTRCNHLPPISCHGPIHHSFEGFEVFYFCIAAGTEDRLA